MRGFISLIIIIIFTSVTYYFIGPVAHSIEDGTKVTDSNFSYADIPALKLQGNATKGKALATGAGACMVCHSIEAVGIKPSMSLEAAAKTFGVAPPDLSDAGAIYSPKFLAEYIANPVKAMKLKSKFNAQTGKAFPMPAFAGAGGNKEQEIADMVAYFQSIAISKDKLTPKTAFVNSCGRCHALKYEKWTQIGFIPKFKTKKDKLAFELNLANYKDSLHKYLGSLPPDLSTIVESKTDHFINTFMQNPQNHIKGTAMPRVGVSADTAKKVMKYLNKSGNPTQAERESLGRDIMIFLVIMAIFAFLWKQSVWKDLH